MKRLFICFIVQIIIFTLISCSHETPPNSEIPSDDESTLDENVNQNDEPSSPMPDYNTLCFDSLDELYAFLYSDESAQTEWISNRYSVGPGYDFDPVEIRRIYEFTQRITRQPIPMISTDESISYVELEEYYVVAVDKNLRVCCESFSVTVYYPMEKYSDYIRNGDLMAYYRNAHPESNFISNPEKYKYLLETVELDRTDMDSEAILFIPESTPQSSIFIREGLIIKITIFNNPEQAVEKLIALANALEIIDVTQECRE